MRHWRRLPIAGVLAFLIGCATGVPEKDVAEVYFKLGNAYFELKQFESAVNAYTQALELDAGLVRAGYNLAHVYLETRRIDEAKRLLVNLLTEEPENSILLSTLAWAHYQQGDLEEALRIYQQVSARLSSDPDAIFNTAMLLWELERYEEALGQFVELYELDPSVEYLPSLAELHRQTGDPETAVRYLELYLAGKENEVEPRISLARLYDEIREYGKAVRMFAEAIELSDSPDPEAVYERARILLLYIEDYEEGMSEIRRAVQLGYSDGERLGELAAELPDERALEIEELITARGLDRDGNEESVNRSGPR